MDMISQWIFGLWGIMYTNDISLIIDELIHGTPFYNGASEDEVFAKIKSDQYIIRDP